MQSRWSSTTSSSSSPHRATSSMDAQDDDASSTAPRKSISSIRQRFSRIAGSPKSRNSVVLDDDHAHANWPQDPHTTIPSKASMDAGESKDGALGSDDEDPSKSVGYTVKSDAAPDHNLSQQPEPHAFQDHSNAAAAETATTYNAHPLDTHKKLILYFVAGTSVTAVLLTHVHWILSLIAIATSAFVLLKQLESAKKDDLWEAEMKAFYTKLNGSSRNNLETAEWVNRTLATVWPLINSEYFVPFADLLEDSLMQQVPGIVHGARVEDMHQGSIPLRIKSFRILDPHEDAFLGETVSDAQEERNGDPIDTGDYINLEVTFSYRAPSRSNRAATNTKGSEKRRDMESAEKEKAQITEHIHLLIYMSIGLQKLAAVSVPVWIEMLGIEGKMRVRLQATPVLPFIKHVAVTFVGCPQLEISAKPLGKRMVIDAMHLPLISTYVLHSVENVIKGFIAPKAYTVDVAALLGAGDGPQDVYALGVIVVVLHNAAGLAAADANGESDPFCQLSFARSGKALYTSRVCAKTKQAWWQEVAFILVNPEELRDHERLRITVLDADRYSADDPLGKIEVSVDRLIRKSRESSGDPKARTLFESRTSDLQPMRRGAKVQGHLSYSIGFFPLAHSEKSANSPRRAALLAEAVRRDDTAKSGDLKATSAVSPTVQPGERASGEDDPTARGLVDYMTGFDRFVRSIGLPLDDAVLEGRRQREIRIAKLTEAIEGSQAATREPPVRDLPSGILAFHIHSLDQLDVSGPTRSKMSSSKRLSAKNNRASTDEGGMSADGTTSKLPSTYVQVIYNDEPIFRTRTKPLNNKPYVNGGSELFITDWRVGELCFVVRDARMRENDPILGVARLRLADVLTRSSAVTNWHVLTGGLGTGKIRITVLFRSVELQIPAPLRGWNLGTVEITACRAHGLPNSMAEKKSCHLFFEAVGGKAETPSAEYVDGQNGTIDLQWPLKDPIRVPIRQRYPTYLYIYLRSDSRVPGRNNKQALTIIPLNRLSDYVGVVRRVPLFEVTDLTALEHDMLQDLARSEERPAAHEEGSSVGQPVLERMCAPNAQVVPDDMGATEGGRLKRVGTLEISLAFRPGVGPEHRGLVPGDHELRFAYEAWLAMLDSGEIPRSRRALARERGQVLGIGAQGAEDVRNADDSPDLELREEAGLHLDTSMIDAARARALRASFDAEDDDDDDLEVEDDFGEGEYDEDGRESGEEGAVGEGNAAAIRRQQRGLAQVGAFRTANWLKTNVEDGIGRIRKAKKGNSHLRRDPPKMQSEGVSHF